MNTTIQPKKKDIKDLTKDLYYISYRTQRDNGMTHQQTVNIGLGNDARKEQYEKELQERTQNDSDAKEN